MATEKDFPLATYSSSAVLPPEFLRRWPYLRSETDLDQYAAASKSARASLIKGRTYLTEAAARPDVTREFYKILRGSLGQ